MTGRRYDPAVVRTAIEKGRGVARDIYPDAEAMGDHTRGLHKMLNALIQHATERRGEHAEHALEWMRWDTALANARRVHEATDTGGGIVAARSHLKEVVSACEQLLNMCNAADELDDGEYELAARTRR